MPELLAGFRREGIDFDHHLTRSLDEAETLCRKANLAGYPVIVAVGGDGTINRVLNGFFDPAGRRLSGASMGVVHTGTSPDFCKSYSIPVAASEAIRCLARRHVTPVRIGRVTCAPRHDPGLDRRSIDDCPDSVVSYFGCCANLGVGPGLAARANSGIRKWMGDLLGTFLALLVTMARFRPSDLEVVQDGDRRTLDRLWNLSIGRTFHIASGIKVKNDLTADDGRLYSLEVRNLGLRHVPGLLYRLYSGRSIINDEIMRLSYCRQVEVLGDARNPQLEFDGDPAGYLPCRIELAQDPLHLVNMESGV